MSLTSAHKLLLNQLSHVMLPNMDFEYQSMSEIGLSMPSIETAWVTNRSHKLRVVFKHELLVVEVQASIFQNVDHQLLVLDVPALYVLTQFFEREQLLQALDGRNLPKLLEPLI